MNLAVGCVTVGSGNPGLDCPFGICDLPMPQFSEMTTTNSQTRGDSRPLLELTIGDLLHRTAGRYPDWVAVASRHQGRRMTWAELSDAADRVARGLWSLGIRHGDRVGIWSTNCIEWIMMHMGCAR